MLLEKFQIVLVLSNALFVSLNSEVISSKYFSPTEKVKRTILENLLPLGRKTIPKSRTRSVYTELETRGPGSLSARKSSFPCAILGSKSSSLHHSIGSKKSNISLILKKLNIGGNKLSPSLNAEDSSEKYKASLLFKHFMKSISNYLVANDLPRLRRNKDNHSKIQNVTQPNKESFRGILIDATQLLNSLIDDLSKKYVEDDDLALICNEVTSINDRNTVAPKTCKGDACADQLSESQLKSSLLKKNYNDELESDSELLKYKGHILPPKILHSWLNDYIKMKTRGKLDLSSSNMNSSEGLLYSNHKIHSYLNNYVNSKNESNGNLHNSSCTKGCIPSPEENNSLLDSALTKRHYETMQCPATVTLILNQIPPTAEKNQSGQMFYNAEDTPNSYKKSSGIILKNKKNSQHEESKPLIVDFPLSEHTSQYLKSSKSSNSSKTIKDMGYEDSIKKIVRKELCRSLDALKGILNCDCYVDDCQSSETNPDYNEDEILNNEMHGETENRNIKHKAPASELTILTISNSKAEIQGDSRDKMKERLPEDGKILYHLPGNDRTKNVISQSKCCRNVQKKKSNVSDYFWSLYEPEFALKNKMWNQFKVHENKLRLGSGNQIEQYLSTVDISFSKVTPHTEIHLMSDADSPPNVASHLEYTPSKPWGTNNSKYLTAGSYLDYGPSKPFEHQYSKYLTAGSDLDYGPSKPFEHQYSKYLTPESVLEFASSEPFEHHNSRYLTPESDSEYVPSKPFHHQNSIALTQESDFEYASSQPFEPQNSNLSTIKESTKAMGTENFTSEENTSEKPNEQKIQGVIPQRKPTKKLFYFRPYLSRKLVPYRRNRLMTTDVKNMSVSKNNATGLIKRISRKEQSNIKQNLRFNENSHNNFYNTLKEEDSDHRLIRKPSEIKNKTI